MSNHFSTFVPDESAATLLGKLTLDLETAYDNISASLPDGKQKALALTKLDECYQWVQLAIKADQIFRHGQEIIVPVS